MKKSLLAAAVLSAVSFGAYADGVELYGVLDAAVVNVSAVGTPDSVFPSSIKLKGGVGSAITSSLTGLVSGGIQGSRWGIKGSEDLGDGMKAVFALESQIQINNGNVPSGWTTQANGAGVSTYDGDASSINGQLFGRQAWVGLSNNDLGTIKFGRQYSVIYDVFNSYDPVQFAGLFTPTGNSGSLAGGGITELVRQDNSVKYEGKTGNVSYTAMYKFGNYAGSSSAGSVFGAQLGYQTGGLNLTAAYQSAIDAVGYQTYTSSTNIAGIAGNITSYIAAAKYMFNDALTGNASYMRVNYSNPSDNDTTLLKALGYSGGYSFTSVNARSVGSNGFNLVSLGGNYKFSEKLCLHAGYYVASYDAKGGLALKESTNAAITENYTSLLLDYNLSKRTDVYVGGMQVNTNRASYSNTNIIGTGLRVKF